MTEVPSELQAAFATVAVTGTNGKTTTTSMIESIVRAAGEPHARVTTLGAWVNGQQVGFGPTLEAFCRGIEEGAAQGLRTLALETTSRALAEGFAQRWPARVAVFTNLSRDHLDYHGDPERYLAAKAQLFMTLPPDGTAVLNACDPASALLEEVTPPGVRRLAHAVSLRSVPSECAALPIALAARSVSVSRSGTVVELCEGELADAFGGAITLQVLGSVNAENALAAALATSALGYSGAAIRRGLAEFQGVPGRFQRVWSDPMVVVDYAHTPDALERTLALARELAMGSGARVGCVFGCGGGSDPGKRPEMGLVAARLADDVWVTTDNPRHEDARVIAEAVLSGARTPRDPRREGSGESDRSLVDREVRLESEPDRRSAIERAIGIARRGRGDIVVIAGKGHETGQCIGDDVIPFDDAEVARAACRERFESEDG